jgi:hypothetical protein
MRRDVYTVNDAESWSAIAADAAAKIINIAKTYSCLVAKVSHLAMSPVLSPVLNHFTRC